MVITKNGSNFDVDYLIDGVSTTSETNVAMATFSSLISTGCIQAGIYINGTTTAFTADNFVYETG